MVSNSICTPSRATILTGQYSHRNGITTLGKGLDPEYNNIPKELIQYPLMRMFGAKESLAIKLIISSNGQFEETDHSNNNVLYDADFS